MRRSRSMPEVFQRRYVQLKADSNVASAGLGRFTGKAWAADVSVAHFAHNGVCDGGFSFTGTAVEWRNCQRTDIQSPRGRERATGQTFVHNNRRWPIAGVPGL